MENLWVSGGEVHGYVQLPFLDYHQLTFDNNNCIVNSTSFRPLTVHARFLKYIHVSY